MYYEYFNFQSLYIKVSRNTKKNKKVISIETITS